MDEIQTTYICLAAIAVMYSDPAVRYTIKNSGKVISQIKEHFDKMKSIDYKILED